MLSPKRQRLLSAFLFVFQLAAGATLVSAAITQDTAKQGLTPVQLEIEKQRQVLSSADVEERRQALVRLRELRHPQASRAAQAALSDPSPIVRGTATASVLSLPAEESAASLLPLLSDKDEFVRQQAAYALGQTRSRSAVTPLVERLSDKQDSVRGAAAVALGEIADATAVTYLSTILSRQSGLPTPKGKKNKPERNPFVLRAAAHSLGQIGDRAALPALLLALQDETMEDDVRREAAWALGRIGDAAAIPVLQQVRTAKDPYLAEIAQEALRRISKLQNGGGV